ncbi:MAG: hypothetical protein HQ559_14360 [Lentisphaerae bacterium]|nr:hypothetical protein [Lentisphaerota bacterium]
MTDRTWLRVLWAGAALSMVAGGLMTLATVRRTPDYSERLRAKIGDMERLESLADEAARTETAVNAFETLPSGSSTPLSSILTNVFPQGMTAEIREMDGGPTAEGWDRQRFEVAFGEAPIDEVFRFAAAAESSRPPWLLVRCDLASTPGSPGSGRAVLWFESLEKKPPTDH